MCIRDSSWIAPKSSRRKSALSALTGGLSMLRTSTLFRSSCFKTLGLCVLSIEQIYPNWRRPSLCWHSNPAQNVLCQWGLALHQTKVTPVLFAIVSSRNYLPLTEINYKSSIIVLVYVFNVKDWFVTCLQAFDFGPFCRVLLWMKLVTMTVEINIRWSIGNHAQ